MTINEDFKLEEDFYNRIFKNYLTSRNNDSIFIRFNSKNIIHQELQKKNDIDVILDNGQENITLSLKTVRKVYKQIFFETISNCTKGTPGWGYYSKADYIVYSMGNFDDGFYSLSFVTRDVLQLDIDAYKPGWGKTYEYDKLLYKTEGRLIPLKDFKHVNLFTQKQSLNFLAGEST